MNINRGKKFEQVIREAFRKVPDTFVMRLPDQTTRYRGTSANICDFVVYKHPTVYFVECKSVHGNTLSIHSEPKKDNNGKLHGFYGNVTDTQWKGLLEASKCPGVVAGVICWWVDHDVTRFISIQQLDSWRTAGNKSIRYDTELGTLIEGKKKKIFYDYNMEKFLW